MAVIPPLLLFSLLLLFFKEELAVLYLVIFLHRSNMFSLSLLLFLSGGRFPYLLACSHVHATAALMKKLSYFAKLCLLIFEGPHSPHTHTVS